MKKSTIVTIILIAAAVVLGVIFISWYLRKATPLYIQGTVECTTYKASSKVPGRIEEMKVEEGQHVTKGELLYTLSTPELNAKLQQAEGAVSEVESYLSDALVYSPVTGEVSTIIAEAGELVGTGYPVVAILDMSDVWVTFNIKEDLMPDIHIGTRMTGYIPALDRSVEFEVTYIAVQADFATWSATRTQGGFDIRTFAVKAKPTQDVEYIRPGMSVLVNWKDIAK